MFKQLVHILFNRDSSHQLIEALEEDLRGRTQSPEPNFQAADTFFQTQGWTAKTLQGKQLDLLAVHQRGEDAGGWDPRFRRHICRSLGVDATCPSPPTHDVYRLQDARLGTEQAIAYFMTQAGLYASVAEEESTKFALHRAERLQHALTGMAGLQCIQMQLAALRILWQLPDFNNVAQYLKTRPHLLQPSMLGIEDCQAFLNVAPALKDQGKIATSPISVFGNAVATRIQQARVSPEMSEAWTLLHDRLSNVFMPNSVYDIADDAATHKWQQHLSHIPHDIRAIAAAKIQAYKTASDEDKLTLQLWLDTVLKFPFTKRGDDISKDNFITVFNRALNSLNTHVYGQDEAKGRFLDVLHILWKKKSSTGMAGDAPILALFGEPGTGKSTLVGTALKHALKRPVITFNMNGRESASTFFGLAKGIRGTGPGQIVQEFIKAGCCDPILVFEEIDKIAGHDYGLSIFSKLMRLAESGGDRQLQDEFVPEVNFDISEATIIFTFNDKEKIPKALLNRMEIIETRRLTAAEREHVVKHFVIPGLLKDAGLTNHEITIEDEVIRHAFKEVEDSASLRDVRIRLKRYIERADRKVAEGRLNFPVRAIIGRDGQVVMVNS